MDTKQDREEEFGCYCGIVIFVVDSWEYVEILDWIGQYVSDIDKIHEG